MRHMSSQRVVATLHGASLRVAQKTRPRCKAFGHAQRRQHQERPEVAVATNQAHLFSLASPSAKSRSSGAAAAATPPPPRPLLSTAKISSLRTGQIARHLSSSSLPSDSSQRLRDQNPNLNMAYQTRKVAAPNTLEHRVYIEKDGIPVSPFHDVPLYANADQTVLNMIVEIPRWTNAKLEVSLPFDLP